MAQPVLSQEEANQVIQLLSQFDVFTYDARSRRDFVHAAGLGKYSERIDWCGSVGEVAIQLVDSLNAAGPMSENPNYHALGKLLVYSLSWSTIGKEDARSMAELIVRHSLVSDLGYLEKLREVYNLGDVPSSGLIMPAAHLAATPPVITPPFSTRPVLKDQPDLEEKLFEGENSLDINFLAGAIYSAQAVGRVESPINNVLGTGWLIAPNLFLTNFHVLPTREYAEEGIVRFGHCMDAYGVEAPGECLVKIDPSFYYTSPADELDYALVRLEERPLGNRMITGGVGSLSMLDLLGRNKHRGFLVASQQSAVDLNSVQLLHYPNCAELRMVMAPSLVAGKETKNQLHYYADTQPGSSGSPVFNRFWEVVALHHSSGPDPDGADTSLTLHGRQTRLNEGILLRAILADLRRRTIDNTTIPLIALIPDAK